MYRVTFIRPDGEEFISPLIKDDDLTSPDREELLEYACNTVEYFDFTFNYSLDFVIDEV